MNTITFMLTVSIAVTGVIYTLVILCVINALQKVHKGGHLHVVSVSVIIAARNERSRIGRCLAALTLQDYPADTWEILVADDRSSDSTCEVIRRFQTVLDKLSCIRIDTVPAGISPKKNALAQAIGHARGEIILQTDADCIPPPSWISGMVSRFEKETAMVAGIAPYLPEPGMLNSFVRHEYLWNAALSAASITLRHGTHASGRNLAFRRNVFEHLGGYDSMRTILSGDDTLLLQRFRKYNPSSVVTMPAVSTHVHTTSPRTFGSFVRQRIRHMSTGRYFDPFFIILGMVIYGFHLLLIASLILSTVSAMLLVIFLGGFLWKCMWDAIAAKRVKTVLELDVSWKGFMVNEMLLTLYMAVMPVLGLFVPVIWKEND